MKATKSVLSAQLEKTAIAQLKAICDKEKRSQAKQLEILIEKEFKALKLDTSQ